MCRLALETHVRRFHQVHGSCLTARNRSCRHRAVQREFLHTLKHVGRRPEVEFVDIGEDFSFRREKIMDDPHRAGFKCHRVISIGQIKGLS